MAGVIAVVTGELMAQHNLAWMPTLSGDTQAVLVTDKVRFQGQEVAAVDRRPTPTREGRPGADRCRLRTARRRWSTPQQRAAADAPRIRDEKEDQTDNHIYHWESGDKEATDSLRGGGQVVVARHVLPAVTPSPLETCGCIADVNPATGQATIYMTSQAPHAHPHGVRAGGRSS